MYRYPIRQPLITGCSFIKNEEHWIRECLESHMPYFDALIVVDGSTDGTAAILKEYGAIVVPEQGMAFHAGNFRNLMIRQMGTPWAWFFFADERIKTDMSPAKIRNWVWSLGEQGYDIIRLRRFNRTNNPALEPLDYPDLQGNIVRPSVIYQGQCHEMPTGIRDYCATGEPIEIDHLLRPRNIERPEDPWALQRWRSHRT